MLELLNLLAPAKLLGFFVKPLVRVMLGLVAIPVCRLFLHRVVHLKDLSAELEKDISQWIRQSLLLLVATRNMESLFFHWVPVEWDEAYIWILGGRLLLAIGVIEGMPDQALFSIIHPGPPALKLQRGRFWASLRDYSWPFVKGVFWKHLNRSSPVLAILTVFLPGSVGWLCYALAIANYLVIGLVSSRDKALDVLQQFDEAVEQQREQIAVVLQHHPSEPTPSQRVNAAEHGGPFPAPLEADSPE